MQKKGLRCIFYRYAKTEHDLSKEDWMILSERVDKEHFIIAKKTTLRRDSSTPTTPLLTAVSSDLLGQGHQPQLSIYTYKLPSRRIFGLWT
jgi:hypothetical protein